MVTCMIGWIACVPSPCSAPPGLTSKSRMNQAQRRPFNVHGRYFEADQHMEKVCTTLATRGVKSKKAKVMD